jgi:hypothetical protein
MSTEPPLGLTQVATDDLKALLRHVHRGDLACPVTPEGLARVGLQDRTEGILHGLRGLDEAGVRAVLVAVLAERESS